MGFTEQMTDFLVQHQSLLRFGAFAGLLAMFSLLEALFERKARSATRLQRWPGAFGLFVVGGVVSRLLVAGDHGRRGRLGERASCRLAQLGAAFGAVVRVDDRDCRAGFGDLGATSGHARRSGFVAPAPRPS
jgi:hypothetical protein